jgi:hypothetical protein
MIHHDALHNDSLHNDSLHHDSLHHDSIIHSHFSKDGTFKGTSLKNVFGGKDYYDSHGLLKGLTMKNVFGGHDYYDSHMNFDGSSIPGPGTHHFLGSNGHMHHHGPEFLHSDQMHNMRMDLLNKIR